MSTDAYLIGIGGPSGSGKSVLARAVCDLAPVRAAVVPMDAYYRDQGGLDPAARAAVNFDHPDALEHTLLAEHLRRLARGEGVDRPVYRFAGHRRARRTERIEPVPLVVLEGLLALHWTAIRLLLGTAVFVELDDATCLERRLRRDTALRGRSRESVLAQYAKTVRPMRERFVMPTRAFAHLVLSGADPPEASARRILARVTALGVSGTPGGGSRAAPRSEWK